MTVIQLFSSSLPERKIYDKKLCIVLLMVIIFFKIYTLRHLKMINLHYKVNARV